MRSRFAELTAAQQSHFDKLNNAITKQHSMLMKMAEGNTVRDAQLAKHSERINRVDILFDRLDQQLPNLARCVEVCLEVGSNATAITSTLPNIRDQMATTMQTVTQGLDDMEETIRDTFVDLKVNVLTLMLASLDCNITTRFTAADTALAQMASPTHTAGASDGPPQQAEPTAQAKVPAPTGADMALPGLASPTSDDDAPQRIGFRQQLHFARGPLSPQAIEYLI